VLLREYQGERHTVTVVAKGYVWREATYASLSLQKTIDLLERVTRLQAMKTEE
jgi:hypothetical protein